MSFELRADRDVGKEVRRVAARRLTLALEDLSRLAQGDPASIEESVHAMRKRCKEVRALARLVRPAIGRDFDEFDRAVRDAADAVATTRDAHAVLQTFDRARAAYRGTSIADLDVVRSVLVEDAERATLHVSDADPALGAAAALLETARAGVSSWNIRHGAGALATGIGSTFERGRRAMRRADLDPSDARMHEWRKAVKHLWYDVRLVEYAAPSMLGPLADVLDGLAEALGDHHDLAVLVQRLESDPMRFGGPGPVHVAVTLAREQQNELRTRASRLGATVYAERPKAFQRRVGAYWDLASQLGPEEVTGGLSVVTALPTPDARPIKADTSTLRTDDRTVELERKFLVDTPPDCLADGNDIDQGYLTRNDAVTLRVRRVTSDDGSRVHYTLTVKGGHGRARTEIECPIGPAQFDALWPFSRDRRVRKTRYRIPFEHHIIEFDIFHDVLDGLLLAEVEFETEAEMASFEPPGWFGRDVSDDATYSNASLATHPPGAGDDRRRSP